MSVGLAGAAALFVFTLWATRPGELPVDPVPDGAPIVAPTAKTGAEQDTTAIADASQPDYRVAPGQAAPQRADSSQQETGTPARHDRNRANSKTGYGAAGESAWRANDDAKGTVEGPLSISGRVLNVDGTAVPGVEIVARSHDTYEAVQDLIERQTRSDASGFYEIPGLVEGDYALRTVATTRYPSAEKIVRAGLHSADIVLAATHTVRLYGTVSDVSAIPLAEVTVSPAGQPNAGTWTDDAGNYETWLHVGQQASTYTVRFSRAGFVEERIYLQSADLKAVSELRLDPRLRELDQTGSVAGTLRSDRGDAVASETVQLHSPSLKTEYLARSNEDGVFSMPAVKTGSDYRLTIHPEGGYQNYSEAGIVIGAGNQTLRVMLRSLDTGRLTGRIIDVEGYPVPGYSLLLKSNKSHGRPLIVSADDGGYFVVENAPVGNLVLTSQSEPKYVVSGISLEANTEKSVDVVIDWGNHEMAGWVRDEIGNPLAAASVGLSWNDQSRGVNSSSTRQAVTDDNGYFRFTQLGPGPHLLDVVAPGYQRLQQVYVVGAYLQEISVELQEVSR